MNKDWDAFFLLAAWLAAIYAAMAFFVVPAYESVFMTTGHYKGSYCTRNDSSEVCYRHLVKTAVSKGRQFVVIKADGESPKKLEGCAVFSKSEWECTDYLLLANDVIGSSKSSGPLTMTARLEPVWPTTYLYHWAKDTWSGCYAGPKHQKLTRLDTQACFDAYNRLEPAPPAPPAD